MNGERMEDVGAKLQAEEDEDDMMELIFKQMQAVAGISFMSIPPDAQAVRYKFIPTASRASSRNQKVAPPQPSPQMKGRRQKQREEEQRKSSTASKWGTLASVIILILVLARCGMKILRSSQDSAPSRRESPAVNY
jgi:hypothetical protein